MARYEHTAPCLRLGRTNTHTHTHIHTRRRRYTTGLGSSHNGLRCLLRQASAVDQLSSWFCCCYSSYFSCRCCFRTFYNLASHMLLRGVPAAFGAYRSGNRWLPVLDWFTQKGLFSNLLSTENFPWAMHQLSICFFSHSPLPRD